MLGKWARAPAEKILSSRGGPKIEPKAYYINLVFYNPNRWTDKPNVILLFYGFLGIEFTWFCRNTTESFPKIITEAINGVVNVSWEELTALRPSPDQGCYRNGQYLLSKTASLELTTNQMVQNETYVIVLVVTKGKRTSSATQKLEIGPENLPTLTIR